MSNLGYNDNFLQIYKKKLWQNFYDDINIIEQKWYIQGNILKIVKC